MDTFSMLVRAAALYPRNTAAVDNRRAFNYGELLERVRAMAAHLHARGVRTGDVVAILEVNSIEFLESYFSVAAVGGILSPLNMHLAAAELAAILRKSKARVLIANAAFAPLVEAAISSDTLVERVIWIGGEKPIAGKVATENYDNARRAEPCELPDALESQRPAHLYFTSGTTGEAKGVVLTHRNVATHATATIAELGISERDVWGHFAPMYHLADAWACFAVTMVGGTHVFAERFAPDTTLAAIEKHRVTITNLIPTMLAAIYRFDGADAFDVASMRTIISGGAPIAPTLVHHVQALFGCEYVQTYGLTETSPFLTISTLTEALRKLPPAEQFQWKCKTGRPMVVVELKVVGADGREVARDDAAVGEIWARGETVSPGYWNDGEIVSALQPGGWLKTGDLATVDQRGYLTIVDRAKDMIITGGENVFSIEVENVLCAHPDVVEAAAFGLPDDYWGEVVAAAVVRSNGSNVGDNQLVEHCRASLAKFKVPKQFIWLDALPKTATGKISKKQLRDRYAS